MKFITDRVKMILMGLIVIIVGVISPRRCREEIFGIPDTEDPVEVRRRHREMFLKQHREMTGE